MANWIGATEAQRFHQYIKPAAERGIASNYKEVLRKEIAANVRELRAAHKAAKTDLQRKKANRRIRAQLDEWKRVCAAWDRDMEILNRA